MRIWANASGIFVGIALAIHGVPTVETAPAEFQLEEATIEDIHAAMQSGELTSRRLVRGDRLLLQVVLA